MSDLLKLWIYFDLVYIASINALWSWVRLPPVGIVACRSILQRYFVPTVPARIKNIDVGCPCRNSYVQKLDFRIAYNKWELNLVAIGRCPL